MDQYNRTFWLDEYVEKVMMMSLKDISHENLVLRKPNLILNLIFGFLSLGLPIIV